MHIAICDDNVLDRKQMERLLKREGQRRASISQGFYIDSFGDSEPLLHKAMQYDVFYVDICMTESNTGVDVVGSLLAVGVNAPIVLCCSAINYREYSFPANIFFLDKPIKVKELSDSIERALSIREQAPSLIELRMECRSFTDESTVYVTEPNILYATRKGHLIVVFLTDGRQIPIPSTLENFYAQLEVHPTFFAPSGKVIINGRNIQELQQNKAIMRDGAVFRIGSRYLKYAKKIMEEYS